MYKHKRRKKTHHAKRRRVGAVSSNMGNTLMTMGGVVAGAVLSRFVDNIIAKQTTVTIDPKMLQIGKVAAGGFVAWKMKNALVKGIGMGFAAEAAVNELVAMKVLTGLGGGFGRVNPASLAFSQQRLNGPGKSQTIWPSVGQPVAPAVVGRAGLYNGVYQ